MLVCSALGKDPYEENTLSQSIVFSFVGMIGSRYTSTSLLHVGLVNGGGWTRAYIAVNIMWYHNHILIGYILVSITYTEFDV